MPVEEAVGPGAHALLKMEEILPFRVPLARRAEVLELLVGVNEVDIDVAIALGLETSRLDQLMEQGDGGAGPSSGSS